jgi:hypothetical protein
MIEKIGFDVNAGEVATLTSASQRAVMRDVKSGKLETTFIGARRIATRVQVDAWLERCKQTGIPKARSRTVERLQKVAAKARAGKVRK